MVVLEVNLTNPITSRLVVYAHVMQDLPSLVPLVEDCLRMRYFCPLLELDAKSALPLISHVPAGKVTESNVDSVVDDAKEIVEAALLVGDG